MGVGASWAGRGIDRSPAAWLAGPSWGGLGEAWPSDGDPAYHQQQQQQQQQRAAQLRQQPPDVRRDDVDAGESTAQKRRTPRLIIARPISGRTAPE